MDYNIKGYNEFIATEPFKVKNVEVKVENLYGYIDQKQSLTPLKVVFGYKDITNDATVYVEADCFKHAFATKVYEFDGKEIILVPVSFVRLVGYPRHYKSAFKSDQIGPEQVNLDEAFLLKEKEAAPKGELSESINSR